MRCNKQQSDIIERAVLSSRPHSEPMTRQERAADRYEYGGTTEHCIQLVNQTCLRPAVAGAIRRFLRCIGTAGAKVIFERPERELVRGPHEYHNGQEARAAGPPNGSKLSIVVMRSRVAYIGSIV